MDSTTDLYSSIARLVWVLRDLVACVQACRRCSCKGTSLQREVMAYLANEFGLEM